MKEKEIKNRFENKSGYGKEIIENEIKYDTEKNIAKNKMKYDSENKSADDKYNIEVGEDVTAYGEFISSYFAWIPLSRQKRRAEELNEMTKNKKDVDK